jgi:monoterpene epsilon-lactone hydrolase
MSLRGEALRLALRCFFKSRKGTRPNLAAIRRGMETTKRFVPNPPKVTKAIRVTAGGVPAVRVTMPRSRDGHHILYLHGGAYAYGAPTHYRDFIWRIADATGAAVLCIDYRLAPEHPFPAAVTDATSAYRWMLAEGANPGRTAIMGDSAGGGMVFGALLKLRDDGAPMPAAAVALSPWTDLALTGESIRVNAGNDPMLSADQASVFTDWYLGGADPRHPHASPLYGDMAGLPPSLIQVGSDEILRDDAVRMADRLRSAGCEAELEIWPRMPHVWPLYARVLPEGRRAVERIGGFVRARLGG